MITRRKQLGFIGVGNRRVMGGPDRDAVVAPVVNPDAILTEDAQELTTEDGQTLEQG